MTEDCEGCSFGCHAWHCPVNIQGDCEYPRCAEHPQGEAALRRMSSGMPASSNESEVSV